MVVSLVAGAATVVQEGRGVTNEVVSRFQTTSITATPGPIEGRLSNGVTNGVTWVTRGGVKEKGYCVS